ncbi:hypothetical protein CR205_12430 [Alteribacter lacisalsi]|uniref:Uncharacterized protein n=1 Tax=Alteribacter lacisalsi TaxID=2045244 RepID=A0A2W0HJL9_9BACI|nr:hypothetical protein CR205_12430 [Alteribacter lacisalsi]
MPALLFAAVLLFLFDYLMGYRKNHIVIDFDELYPDLDEHMTAVHERLEHEGKTVETNGYRSFIINGRSYLFTERTVNIGGVPVQRTILKPGKKQT